MSATWGSTSTDLTSGDHLGDDQLDNVDGCTDVRKSFTLMLAAIFKKIYCKVIGRALVLG